MARTREKALPMHAIEVCEPPSQAPKTGKKNPWDGVIEKVRELAGRSAKICHHPKAHLMAVQLRKKYPDIAFTSRKLSAGDKPTYGLWARLNVVVPESPIPELPTLNGMSEPVLG